MVRVFSTLGCPQATLAEALALAERHGLDGVELRALGGTIELPAYFRGLFAGPAALAAELGDRAARVFALGASLRIIDGTADDRARLLEYVPWAEALGIRWLRVFDGGRTADAAEIARGADTLRWWRALRAARGWAVDLMVETHDALVTTPGIERLLAAAPSTAILWDAHHTWRRGGEDPVATWRVIGSHVVHVHVKDSLPSTGTRLPYAYVLPGTGEFPMAPLRRALGGGWTGALSLEWEKLWHPQLPELDEALRSAAERRWW